MEAFACVKTLLVELSPIGETRVPTNEYQVRSLVTQFKDQPDQWVKIWKQVLSKADGKPVTGEMVEAVVDELKAPEANTGNGSSRKAKAGAKAKKALEAKKLVKVSKLVTKALGHKTPLSADKLIKILEKIRKLVA